MLPVRAGRDSSKFKSEELAVVPKIFWLSSQNQMLAEAAFWENVSHYKNSQIFFWLTLFKIYLMENHHNIFLKIRTRIITCLQIYPFELVFLFPFLHLLHLLIWSYSIWTHWRSHIDIKLTHCTNKLRNACTRVNNYMFITTLDKRWS